MERAKKFSEEEMRTVDEFVDWPVGSLSGGGGGGKIRCAAKAVGGSSGQRSLLAERLFQPEQK